MESYYLVDKVTVEQFFEMVPADTNILFIRVCSWFKLARTNRRYNSHISIYVQANKIDREEYALHNNNQGLLVAFRSREWYQSFIVMRRDG